MSILVRERMPTRLSAFLKTAGGTYKHRWGEDGKAEDAISALSCSDTMPGGFEQLSGTLARRPELPYADLSEFETITLEGVGGKVACEGRLETSPRQSGDQENVTFGAVGWVAALDDNKSAREIIVDRDLTQWAAESVQMKINDSGAGSDVDDASSQPDQATGYPSLVCGFQSPWSRIHRARGWYDARGIPIGSVYYAWKINPQINATDANWIWKIMLANDDVQTGLQDPGSFRAAGPGTGTLTANDRAKKYAIAELSYNAAFAADSGVERDLYWTCLAVYGAHGLTPRGTADFQNAQGFYAQDVVQYVVGKYAPVLATSRAGISTVSSSSAFVIPHLVWADPVAVSQMVKDATRFELQDWAVWEGPAFYWNDYGARGKKWRARVGPAKLQDTGPQADRIWNNVLVQYTDVAGISRTVGPVGSGSTLEDASLTDSDPANPANAAGLTRVSPLSMGTSTPAGALKIGQTFLAQQKLRSTAGQATLTGHVEDEHGVLWPSWAVRAGDSISFVDASDASYRRVVKKSYDHATRTATIDLDSPPDAMQDLLERMSVVLVPLGF